VGNKHARVRGNLTAKIWKEKQDVHILTKMYKPPAKDEFSFEYGITQKHVTGED
jgi:hypothetical protein